MLKIKIALTAALIVVASSVGASAQTSLVDTFRDWATYKHAGIPSKICFALSQPTDTTSEEDRREPVFFYISAWPKDGVKAEISIKMGHMIKKDSITTIKIGSARFRLLSEADKAFVDDATAELKLLQSMKSGSEMKVESIAANGASVTDTYSLRGVTKAIKSLAGSCS